ncbi:MAG: excinuclease ABC subunit UvrA [Bacteroidota bacterium]|nr:excinuclease ABC subunit UvrA [Bacteroidota bacterium]
MHSRIQIVNASENNLKNISLEIPKYQLVVVTGVSGSGKSSLVYDVIFREAESRYLASFSSQARQFMGKMKSPEVEKIDGLSPAIAINQKTVVRNPRSTVGTLSGIYDYLRLIFARFGKSTNRESGFRVDRNLFSFNHPEGACENCHGLGVEDRIAPDLLIEDPAKSLREGALLITTPSGYIIYSQVTMDVLNQVCEAEGFNVDIPWQELSEYQKKIVLYGSDKIEIPFGKHTLESRMRWSGITAKPRNMGYYKGIIPVMEEILKRDRNKNILRFTRSETCPACSGRRLNQKALSVKWQGRNIAEFAALSLQETAQVLNRIKDNNPGHEAWNIIIGKILARTALLDQLGVSYLELKRESTSLSGGEAQRLRLANQVNAELREVLYVFDEPSIGLHPSENKKMIGVLKKLRDRGNTVLVVEHDDDFIRQADHLIDLGPRAGKAGGEIMLNAPLKELNNIRSESETLKYLLGTEKFSPLPPINHHHEELIIEGAREHNLKHINVKFKLQALNVITGVSGAGKSTLANLSLGRFLQKKLHASRQRPGAFDSIRGWEKLKKLVSIDQAPIGRTPRSNPATYTKLFDLIRDLFASRPESKARAWGKGRFSFNIKGGRCEACQGAGYQQIGMHFMGNVEIPCEHCNGQRFNKETLEIRYKGLNIFEVLELAVEEALGFFSEEKKILRILSVMHELGLGYIKLGQRSTSLSGGEAQRVKLASELARPTAGHCLYLLDEPTTGLHNADVKVLLLSLRSLLEKHHTVLVIEHHPGIIIPADHIVDLGPGSGHEGGRLVFQGSLQELLQCNDSLTAAAMREYLQGNTGITASPERKIPLTGIRLQGVNTHNCKNIDLWIPAES